MPSTSGKPKPAVFAPAATMAPPCDATAANSSIPVLLCATTILLSAFLLFQVELMMGKFLLPRFGGGPSVWSTSLLVFQLLLLAGYGYAAFICVRLNPKTQAVVHVVLLAISGLILAFLSTVMRSPLFPRAYLIRPSTEYPVGHIALLLVLSVGIQCTLLSATSPLLQHWFSRQQQGSPYRLYALSNLGSLLGLLAYPFLVERLLTLSSQAWLWISGYSLFALSAAGCAFLAARHKNPPNRGDPSRKKAKRKRRNVSESQPKVLWLALAACSCMMLLATTNLICQQIAPIPLLWVLPLSLYLLSFIICFDHARWYRRGIFHPFYLFWALSALRLLPVYTALPTSGLLVVYSLAQMAVCMVCHGEMARLKPEAQHLTSFYLLVSAGGALGSAAVVLLAPQIFDRFWEYQIALLGCGILLAVCVIRDRTSWVYDLRYGGIVLAGAAILMAIGTYFFTDQLLNSEGEGDTVLARTRNFFGVKTVLNAEEGRELRHGHTLHGLQNITPENRDEPTAYYSRDSGIGLLLDHYPHHSDRPLRIGLIGMGAGTLAAYGKSGDYFRYYEIDTSITEFSSGSHPYFTFVKDSPAHTDIVLGDGRIKLQEELSRGESQNFDVLVVDAFSGDSIPVHLLTNEAMGIYLRHLRGVDSVIGFHVSSRTLSLQPVLEALARSYNMAIIEVDTSSDLGSSWILLSRNPDALRIPELVSSGHPLDAKAPARLWTDDYSSLYETLHW
jgi:hypothetical protein